MGDPNQDERTPDARYYYIATRKHGFVGNCVVFWRGQGRGYTTNLNDAGEYSSAEAREIVEQAPTGECRMLPVEDVWNLHRPYFDAQDMPKLGGWEPDGGDGDHG